MIPGVELSTVLAVLGYGVAFIIFAETGLMVGFFLPGDSLLFTAGAITGIGKLDVDIYLLTSLFFIAAILGNTTGYLIGKHFGRKLFEKPDNKFFKQKYLKKAEEFYAKHGTKAVILAQLMPILRTFNPVVTGIAKMNYKKFITFNIIGALIWTGGFTLGGYFIFRGVGQVIDPETIDLYMFPIIVLIVLLSFTPAIIHVLKNPDNRAMIKAKTKAIFNNKPKEVKKNGKRS